MKINFLILIAVLFVTNLFGQISNPQIAISKNGNDTIGFEVEIDEPTNTPKTSIFFSPLHLAASKSIRGNGISFGFRRTFSNDKLFICAQYSRKFPIIETDFRLNELTKAANVNTQSFSPFSSFDFKLGFLINEKITEEPVKLDIHSEYVSNKSTRIKTTYLLSKAHSRKMKRINLGVYNYSTSLYFNDIDYLEANDGTKFYKDEIVYNAQNVNSQPIQNKIVGTGWGTQMKTTSLLIGLSTTKTTNYYIKSKYGSRGEMQYVSYYCDIMYAPVIKIDDIIYYASDINGNIGTTLKPFTIKNFQKNPFGFRFGLDWNKFYPMKIGKWKDAPQSNEFNIYTKAHTRTLNLGLKLEVGMLPGIKSKGAFVQFTLYAPIINF